MPNRFAQEALAQIKNRDKLLKMPVGTRLAKAYDKSIDNGPLRKIKLVLQIVHTLCR